MTLTTNSFHQGMMNASIVFLTTNTRVFIVTTWLSFGNARMSIPCHFLEHSQDGRVVVLVDGMHQVVCFRHTKLFNELIQNHDVQQYLYDCVTMIIARYTEVSMNIGQLCRGGGGV